MNEKANKTKDGAFRFPIEPNAKAIRGFVFDNFLRVAILASALA